MSDEEDNKATERLHSPKMLVLFSLISILLLMLIFSLISIVPNNTIDVFVKYAAAQTQPTSIPNSINYYLPITITNYQLSPTATPFQQKILINSANYSTYESSNLQNIEFFYANGTIIPSWLESGNSNSSSSTIYWIKLSMVIPSSSSITIYAGFASPSTNLFNA